jgi:hypothetical protein
VKIQVLRINIDDGDDDDDDDDDGCDDGDECLV